MTKEDVGGTLKNFCCAELVGRLASKVKPCGTDRDICGRVRYRVCTKFLKTTVACVHVFSNEGAVPLKNGLLWNGYELGWKIIGELQHLRFCGIGLHHCRVRVLAGWSWGLVDFAELPTTFAPPAVLGVRAYLP